MKGAQGSGHKPCWPGPGSPVDFVLRLEFVLRKKPPAMHWCFRIRGRACARQPHAAHRLSKRCAGCTGQARCLHSRRTPHRGGHCFQKQKGLL